MSKTYVRSIKFSQSGETYWVRDADAQESIATLQTDKADTNAVYTKEEANALLDKKQVVLESGVNIKTINNTSILGSGNIDIQGGSGTSDYESLSNIPAIDGNELHANSTAADLGLATAAELAGKQDALPSTTDQEGKYLKVDSEGGLVWAAGGGSGGTSDYTELDNKPQINGVTLSGNKSASDLGLLTSNLGSENAGKVLKIDTDGSIISAEVAGSTVDDEMSTVSTNPVQNKVITETVNTVNDRVDYLEDGLSEDVHHYSEVTVFDTNITVPYANSTFCGWGASIGHPNRIDKVVVPYAVRADAPVSKCRLNIFRINEAITDADFASESSNSPQIGSKLELLATKTLEFEPITTAGEQRVVFELDTPVLNPDDKTIMLEFLANNVISEGYAVISTRPQTVEAGYGPGVNWSAYNAISETPYTSFASGLTEKVGVATATCNLASSSYNVRTNEANNQFYVFAGTVSYYEDDVEKILFNPERVTDLEDQLYDDIEHTEEHITQDWITKGSANDYKTSTFSGWLGSIGRPDKIGWVEFNIRGRGTETPITWVRCRVYKMTRDLVESDYTYTEGSDTPYSNPQLKDIAVKVADKTLYFDEDPITGNRTVRFDLDKIIDNTEEHCQYLVGYNCNNVESGGYRSQTGGISPFGGGFTGPWIAYTTWNGTSTSSDFDSTINNPIYSGLNLTGNAYNTEHLATPRYYFIGAKIGYNEGWIERKITPEPDGKVGTIVQGVIEEMGIQDQLDAAITATQLVEPTIVPVYQGYSSLDLTTSNAYSFFNPSSTFTGETQPIGIIPADVDIGGFRIPFKIRVLDDSPTTATSASIYLYECDSTAENDTNLWTSLNPVLVRSKTITVDLDNNNPDKQSGIYDFYFDEVYHNTNGKHLYLGTQLNARFYRVQTSSALLNYLNTKYNLGLSSVKSFYSVNPSPTNPDHANRWQNPNCFAYSIIMPDDIYIASDKFNEWVDERTSGTIAQEVEEYLDTHNLPVSPSYEVRLAKKYYAVVGDKLQLFYDGLIKGINPSQIADITVRCPKGKNYPRYWEWTPTAEDAGNSYSFKLYVRNFQGEIVSQGQTTIEVLAVPTYSEATTYNMLGFGDSLTSSGAWFGEGMRRLVGTDSSAVGPASLQVPNLTLSSYGKKRNTVNTLVTYHEGYGGWTWGSFLATTGGGSTVNGIFVTLNHTVTWDLNTVQHSVWVDQNSKNWVLEDIDGAKIKFDRGSGNNAAQSNTQLPTSLHCSALSLDITQTEISNATWESGNPFYDDDTGRVNFVAHAQELGHAPADIVSCLLTWNGGGGELDFNYQGKITAHMSNATTLLRDIHSDLPNAKIICVGIQLPSITGGAGANYDANGGYADQNATYYYAYDYNKALENLVTNEEFGSYCYYVDTKGQFDTKYLMPYDTVAVNTRSTVTEMRGTNGVHPSTNGYYAIGDAYFRTLVKVLNDLQA